MNRRWSSLAVTVLCCLLALATSASAECAWIMWTGSQGTSGFNGAQSEGWYDPMVHQKAFDTRSQCMAETRKHLDKIKARLHKASMKLVDDLDDWVGFSRPGSMAVDTYEGECWPLGMAPPKRD